MGVKQKDKEKQEAFKETKKRNDEEMRNLTGLESILIIVIVAFVIGTVFSISENQTNKTYLHISLQENRNYLQMLLQYNPHNTQLEKQLNNTQSEIKQLEHPESIGPLIKIIVVFMGLIVFVYVILPIIPRRKKEENHG